MNYSSGQNILNEVKNWKKTGEYYDTLVCSFLYFLISVVKVLLWRLRTGLCPKNDNLQKRSLWGTVYKNFISSQLVFTCSKFVTDTLEQVVKYV